MQKQHHNIVVGGIYDAATTTQKNQVGRLLRMDDGRTFAYARTDSDITVGDAVIATPDEFNIAATYFGTSTALAPAADEGGSIGDKVIRHCVLTGTATCTVNEYQQGYLCITDGIGEGYMYKVKANTANAAAAVATGTFIDIYDGLKVALTATSVGTMIKSPWWDIDHHTHANYGKTATQFCVGKAMVASTAGTDGTVEFLWVQTFGPTLCQSDTGTVIQGATIQLGEAVDGSVQVPVTAENEIQVIGTGMEAGATTIYAPVFLNICP